MGKWRRNAENWVTSKWILIKWSLISRKFSKNKKKCGRLLARPLKSLAFVSVSALTQKNKMLPFQFCVPFKVKQNHSKVFLLVERNISVRMRISPFYVKSLIDVNLNVTNLKQFVKPFLPVKIKQTNKRNNNTHNQQ